MTSRADERVEKWLLVSNCQAGGLANCLEAQSPWVEVECYDGRAFEAVADDVSRRVDAFDRILVAPRMRDTVGPAIAGHDRVVWVPHVWFQGYHPDVCYLAGDGPLANGPTGAYQSAIAWAAHCAGLSVEQAETLYREDVYAALGYFDSWDRSRDAMVAEFSAHGFDVAGPIVRLSRGRAFMHTVNHPRIGMLMEIAAQVLRRTGTKTLPSAIVPHDNLANGPVFPVFPEIGTRLGVRGDYVFNAGGRYRPRALRDFLAESFRAFAAAGDEQPRNAHFFASIDRAKAVVRRMA